MMYSPKSRRVNIGRMKKYRVRFGIMYQTQRIDRADLEDLDLDMIAFILNEMLNMFRPKVLAHHMYDRYKWGKDMEIAISRDYDIDRDQEIFRMEEKKLK